MCLLSRCFGLFVLKVEGLLLVRCFDLEQASPFCCGCNQSVKTKRGNGKLNKQRAMNDKKQSTKAGMFQHPVLTIFLFWFGVVSKLMVGS
jgi:hypothetical protein